MAQMITKQDMMMMIYQILGEGESYLAVLPGTMILGNARECIFGLTEKNLNVAIQDSSMPSIMTEDIAIPLEDICNISIKKGFMGKTDIILSRSIPGTDRSFPYKLQFAKKAKNCEISSEDYQAAMDVFIEQIKHIVSN